MISYRLRLLTVALLLMCMSHAKAETYTFTGEELCQLLDIGKNLLDDEQAVVANGGALLTSENSDGLSYSFDSDTQSLQITATELNDFSLDVPCFLEGISRIVIDGEGIVLDGYTSHYIGYVNVYSLNADGGQASEICTINSDFASEGFDTEGTEETGSSEILTLHARQGLRLTFGRIYGLEGYKVKSIEVTTTSRDFAFASSAVTATVGGVIEMPGFTGDESWDLYDGEKATTYESSDESVAVIDKERVIHALKAGTAVITAHAEATDNFASGDASFILTVVDAYLDLAGTTEEVTLSEPNTLRYVLADLETTAIGSLTLHGPIGSDDLSLINGQQGRLANLQVLDLSDIQLVADEGTYSTVQTGHNDLNVDIYNVYCLSEREEMEHSGSYNGITGSSTDTYYTMNLGGAFASMTTLKKLVLPAGMTEIGSCIAMGDTALVEVELPQGIEDVPNWAFSGCSKLMSINLGAVKTVGTYAFSNTQLLDIDLSQATSVGSYAFSGTLLTSVDLSNLTQIEAYTFSDCMLLSDVEWGSGLQTIDEYAFYNTALDSLSLPEGVESVMYRAFGETNISALNLPPTVCKMAYDVFNGTPWLEQQEAEVTDGIIYAGNVALRASSRWTVPENYTLTFPEGTVAISEKFSATLDGSENIVKMVLPSTLRRVGESYYYTLYTNLTDVNMPEGLESIGENVFRNTKIATLTVPPTVKEIGDDAFADNTSLLRVTYNPEGEIAGKHIFSGCEALEKVTVGSGVTGIPEYAFYNCAALLKVDFEAPTVAYAKSYAANAKVGEVADEGDDVFIFAPGSFSGCSLLTSFSFPENTDSIGEYAFFGIGITVAQLPWHIRSVGAEAFNQCESLTEVYLPASLQYLDDRAFGNAPITEIYAYGTEPVVVGEQSYSGLMSLAGTAKLYVRPGYQETWDADALWTLFDIYPMDEEHLALGISTPTTDADDANEIGRYNMSGQRIDGTKSGAKFGVNIIRYSDGSIKKIYVK